MRGTVAYSVKVGGVQSSRFFVGRGTEEDFFVCGRGGDSSILNFHSQIFCLRRGTVEYFWVS